ncbi:hypothetical protein GIB67_007159 [Kingdonia uniflora]|uniref:Sister chromatid cohesion protein n=1 Tax=Kingdonia uniflora TaxID=39325 RepID=A0A7J7MLM6_9MAGN|nr:hypothetical protein GIB67_007159 [Kingdonia uniflora]
MSAEALPSFRFDSPSYNQSVIPFLMYCTEILASLPFTAPDEPLYLIYTINRVLQVISGSLKETMKALSSRSIQEDKHAILDENGVLQYDSSLLQQEPYSSAHSVSIHIKEEDAILCSPTLGVSCGILKDNLQSNQADCQAAIALQLLLMLKRHLKIAFDPIRFSICEGRIMRIHVKFVHKLAYVNLFNSKVSLYSSASNCSLLMVRVIDMLTFQEYMIRQDF